MCCLPQETWHAVGVWAVYVGETSASVQPSTRMVRCLDLDHNKASSLRCMCGGRKGARPCQPHSPNTRNHANTTRSPNKTTTHRPGTSLLQLWSPHGQPLLHLTVVAWRGAASRAVSWNRKAQGLRQLAKQMPTQGRTAHAPSLRQVASQEEELPWRFPCA